MKITVNGAVRYLTFGKVAIPIRLSIHSMTDDVRHLSKSEHRMILKHEGVECPGGMDSKDVMLMAMSFVQMEWHISEGKHMSKQLCNRHSDRLTQFLEDVDRIKQHGPTPKVSKLLLQLELPGTPEKTADPREVLS